MPHILKNKNLEVRVDLPDENYNFSRFDWTGKIAEVKFKNILVSTIESEVCGNENHFGKGFYNEFGIDSAFGFDETEIGDWFHKIGVGLLKKEDNDYLFSKNYEIKPAKFKITSDINSIVMTCTSESVNGYAYILKKEIQLHDNDFTITYNLLNTGEKDITSSEYVHNFTAINNDLIGSDYVLKFPFDLKPECFDDTVNPEQKIAIGQRNITFNGTPNAQFFFSNLAGNKDINSKWELTNLNNNITISETGSFKTKKVNLWGWTHVISPELFFDIFVKPGESTTWSRTYSFNKAK